MCQGSAPETQVYGKWCETPTLNRRGKMWVAEQSTRSWGLSCNFVVGKRCSARLGGHGRVNISACTNVICKASLQLVGILMVEHMPTLLQHNSPCCAILPAADTVPQLSCVTRAYRKKKMWVSRRATLKKKSGWRMSGGKVGTLVIGENWDTLQPVQRGGRRIEQKWHHGNWWRKEILMSNKWNKDPNISGIICPNSS